MSRASWGRSLLKTSINFSKRACCWRKLAAAGLVASFFKVRCIKHPVHPLPLNAHRQRVQRLMRAATGTKPVREAFEVDLIYLVEDRHHRLLNNFVLQSRDAQRTLSPVGFRNKDSPRR